MESEGVDEERRTSTHELLFDLVFVYAITQISGLLRDDLTAAGFAHAGIAFGLVWWLWSQYTWSINTIDPSGPVVVTVLLVAATGTFFVAQAIPDAYTDAGAWFALPYLLVFAAGLVLFVKGLGSAPDPSAAIRSYMPVASIPPALVLVGGFGPAAARPWLWSAALVIDVTSALRAGAAEFPIQVKHFAERYSLIVLIALGEAVVAVGLGAAETKRDASFGIAATATLLLIGLLYHSYFGWVAATAERNLRDAPRRTRGRLARDLYTFLHAPIVAGIIGIAVATESVLAHPNQPLTSGARVSLAAGVGLFLGGFVLGNAVVARTWLIERLAAIAAVIAIALVGRRLDALITTALVIVILGAALVAEQRRPATGRNGANALV